eukprot:gnl/TRDRNA2_/TRDRNA2_163631_c4_seq1.p1 gnl/TRDRNA2_/TRDRNA2_163631_c4~~gnl/TRDRNA2_/TRDRNA2_163631_c4_seq1.p1  ORF type:complete len:451 (+),score=101.41 gnl/TRDRNA2_/TRDRNA2_163631_c4_seq1:63-1415(+)
MKLLHSTVSLVQLLTAAIAAVPHRRTVAPLAPWRRHGESPRALQLSRPSRRNELVQLGTQRSRLRSGRLAADAEAKALTGTWQLAEVGSLHALQYYGQVAVGTPSQFFTVIFDSGSGSLLVPGTGCDSPACQSPRRLFQDNKSSTAIPIGWADEPVTKADDPDNRDTATINYAMGDAVGMYTRDRVCVSTACATVDFVETSEESDNPFKDAKFDGIFGLSLSSISPAKEFNVFEQLFAQKSLEKPVFAMYLPPHLGDGAEITFGNWKQEHMEEPMLWTPLSDPGYWQFTLQDVVLNGTSQGFCSQKDGCQAVVDTGSSLLMAPKAIIGKLEKMLSARVKNCNDLSALPKLGFRIGGHLLTMDPEDYMDVGPKTCLFTWMDAPDTGKGPLIVLGMPFLRKYYTVFDFSEGKPRLGFSRANHSNVMAHKSPPKGAKYVDVPLRAERNRPEEK